MIITSTCGFKNEATASGYLKREGLRVGTDGKWHGDGVVAEIVTEDFVFLSKKERAVRLRVKYLPR
jgi:hypothetical protein